MESNSSSSKRSNCVGRSNLHRMADLSDDGIRCKSKRLKAPEILGILGDEKLKNARIEAGLTQEKAAEKIDVSRQTISNWENEKSYPDIISVIALSDLYSVSLDELLKGDQKMAEHLEESTNVVKSNKKLTGAILLNIILMILLIALNMLLPEGTYYLVIVFCVVIMSSSALLYQIIKRI